MKMFSDDLLIIVQGLQPNTEAYCLRLSHQANKLPKTVPDTECQTQATAVATADSALPGKNLALRPVARPAFCTPTSMASVRFLAVFMPVSAPL